MSQIEPTAIATHPQNTRELFVPVEYQLTFFGKVPDQYGDFISCYYYKIADKIEPVLYFWGVTPNMVTIFRFCLILIAVFLIETGRNQVAAILISISYFLDCVDGHYARKYQMVTIMGDYLDHLADIIGYTILTYILINRLWTYPIILLVQFFLTITTTLQTACEEKYVHSWSKQQSSHSLNLIQNFCNPKYNFLLSENLETNLLFLKYFGPGTLFLFISMIVFFYA